MMRGILERLVLSMLEERPRTARALSDALPFRHRLTAKQLGSMLDSDRRFIPVDFIEAAREGAGHGGSHEITIWGVRA